MSQTKTFSDAVQAAAEIFNSKNDCNLAVYWDGENVVGDTVLGLTTRVDLALNNKLQDMARDIAADWESAGITVLEEDTFDDD